MDTTEARLRSLLRRLLDEAAAPNVVPFPGPASAPAPPQKLRRAGVLASVLFAVLLVGAAELPGDGPRAPRAIATVSTLTPAGLTKYRAADCEPAAPGAFVHTTDRLDPCGWAVGEGGYPVF